MGEIDTEAARACIQAASEMVSALCQPRGSAGAREWTMRIPAHPDDPDLVIAAALGTADAALDALDSARAEVVRLTGDGARLAKALRDCMDEIEARDGRGCYAHVEGRYALNAHDGVVKP